MKYRSYVYYPCAGFDGAAIKCFSKEFDFFIYVDNEYNNDIILKKIKEEGFRGYRLKECSNNDDMVGSCFSPLSEIGGFVFACHFKRNKGFGNEPVTVSLPGSIDRAAAGLCTSADKPVF